MHLLEAIVKHEFRLDILICLIAEGPMDVGRLAARIGKPESAIKYHVERLLECDVVERDDVTGVTRYTPTLSHHPDWVLEQVMKHYRGEDSTPGDGS